MKRLLIFAVVLMVGADEFAAAQSTVVNVAKNTSVKIAKKIPLVDYAEAAIRMGDEATKKSSKGFGRIVERGFAKKAEFIFATKDIDVPVDETTSYWRGSVKQSLIMPCPATLTLDFHAVLKNSWVNPETKTIEVYLPPLKIFNVESYPDKSRTNPEYSGQCWEFFDAGEAARLET